jgi:hypothetical protein
MARTIKTEVFDPLPEETLVHRLTELEFASQDSVLANVNFAMIHLGVLTYAPLSYVHKPAGLLTLWSHHLRGLHLQYHYYWRPTCALTVRHFIDMQLPGLNTCWRRVSARDLELTFDAALLEPYPQLVARLLVRLGITPAQDKYFLTLAQCRKLLQRFQMFLVP